MNMSKNSTSLCNDNNSMLHMQQGLTALGLVGTAALCYKGVAECRQKKQKCKAKSEKAKQDNKFINSKLKKIISLENSILANLENDCDFKEITIFAVNVGTSGYVISQSGKYCLGENITFTNAGSPAITIAATATNVYLDLNGYTINLNKIGFAGVFVDPGAGNIIITNGNIVNAAQPPAPGGNIHKLNIVVYGSTSAQGFGVALGAQVFNVLLKNIETDRCFVGIGTLDGGQTNIGVEDCRMYRFGFDYGTNDFRGAGFSFSCPSAGTTPTTRIYSLTMNNCVADSLTGQQSYALRAVVNGYIANSAARVGFNSPLAIAGSPEQSAEESRGFFVLGCDQVILHTCHTINCRIPFSIQNSYACVTTDSVATEFSRVGFATVFADFPTLNVTPLNGLPGQGCSYIGCISKSNILNPNGSDTGIGFILNGASNNILDNCEASYILAGSSKTGLAINLGDSSFAPASGNIIRNCIFSNNSRGIASNNVLNVANSFISNVISNNVAQGVADPTAANANLYESNTANFNGPANAQSTNYSSAVRPVVATTLIANSFTNPVAYYANRTNAVGAVNVP